MYLSEVSVVRSTASNDLPEPGWVPLHHHEVVLQSGQSMAGRSELAASRPTSEEQQHRVVCSLATERYPLIAAVEVDPLQSGDAAGYRFALRINYSGSVGRELGN
jgi:hypothetical protein